MKAGDAVMKRVFVTHPYCADPEGNAARVADIARDLVLAGYLPLAPQIYLPQFINEASERDLALRLCLALVSLSDELRVYGQVTEGMRMEVETARRLQIPIVNGKTGDRQRPKGEPPR